MFLAQILSLRVVQFFLDAAQQDVEPGTKFFFEAVFGQTFS